MSAAQTAALNRLLIGVSLCLTHLSISTTHLINRYYQRYRICRTHNNNSTVMFDGVSSRWCQQCGKFEPLSAFKGDRRTCQVKLLKHNIRRRHPRGAAPRPAASLPAAPMLPLAAVAATVATAANDSALVAALAAQPGGLLSSVIPQQNSSSLLPDLPSAGMASNGATGSSSSQQQLQQQEQAREAAPSHRRQREEGSEETAIVDALPKWGTKKRRRCACCAAPTIGHVLYRQQQQQQRVLQKSRPSAFLAVPASEGNGAAGATAQQRQALQDGQLQHHVRQQLESLLGTRTLQQPMVPVPKANALAGAAQQSAPGAGASASSLSELMHQQISQQLSVAASSAVRDGLLQGPLVMRPSSGAGGGGVMSALSQQQLGRGVHASLDLRQQRGAGTAGLLALLQQQQQQQKQQQQETDKAAVPSPSSFPRASTENGPTTTSQTFHPLSGLFDAALPPAPPIGMAPPPAAAGAGDCPSAAVAAAMLQPSEFASLLQLLAATSNGAAAQQPLGVPATEQGNAWASALLASLLPGQAS